MKFRVKGYVVVTVTRVENEREHFDDIYEAESEAAVQRAIESQAEHQYRTAAEAEVQYSQLCITVIEESDAERSERERSETYRAMVAMNAPRLPGMGVA